MFTLTTSPSRFLFVLPLFVLLVTRLGIEASVALLPLRWAWLPSFAVYYVAIAVSVWYAKRRLNTPFPAVGRLRPLPSGWLLLWGVGLPALLPLGVFILNVQNVPWPMLVGIGLFAAVNPLFEDAFWRGLLAWLPLPKWAVVVVSAALFSVSHYVLWGAYWLANPQVLTATCATTFIMGFCWMRFYQRDGRLIYPILSHMLVDVFNLSVAIFMGLRLATA